MGEQTVVGEDPPQGRGLTIKQIRPVVVLSLVIGLSLLLQGCIGPVPVTAIADETVTSSTGTAPVDGDIIYAQVRVDLLCAVIVVIVTSLVLLVKGACRTTKTYVNPSGTVQQDESEPMLPISEVKFKMSKLTVDILTQMLIKWGIKPRKLKDQLVEQVVEVLKQGNRKLVS